MRLLPLIPSAIVLGALSIFSGTAVRADQVFTVTVDTSSLALGYTPPFGLDFELVGGNGNTITLSNFSFGSGGSSGPGSSFSTGMASGDLASTITLGDSTASFFNDFNQQFTSGSTLSFTVDATTNAPSGGFADNFSAVILEGYDPVNGYNPLALTGGTPVPTLDPSGNDTIVTLNITSPQSAPMIYQLGTVPEPSSAVILMMGLIGTSAAVAYRRLSQAA